MPIVVKIIRERLDSVAGTIYLGSVFGVARHLQCGLRSGAGDGAQANDDDVACGGGTVGAFCFFTSQILAQAKHIDE